MAKQLPTDKPATMADVARRAGVSPITVSRALSHPSRVAAIKLAAIRHAAQELGYVRHAIAGSLASQSSRTIGTVVPVLSNSIFADTIEGLSEVFEARGYRLLIGSSQYDPLREQRFVEAFMEQRVAGVALTGTTHTKGLRALLTRARIPVVEMWNLPRRPLDCSVGFSNYAAARAMVRHLVTRGYRRIAYIGGPTTMNDRTQARERGYRAELAAAGLPIRESLVRRTPFEFENGAKALSGLLDESPAPDAVFAASDVLAVGALLHCLRTGIRVPQQVALAGLDGSAIGSQLAPRLTSICFPRREIGACSARLLLDRIGGAAPGTIEDLGFELILGESA
ncbi:MAG: LacI family DNA-binding transcriptional regulator [Betaproteobacteria bacterium]